VDLTIEKLKAVLRAYKYFKEHPEQQCWTKTDFSGSSRGLQFVAELESYPYENYYIHFYDGCVHDLRIHFNTCDELLKLFEPSEEKNPESEAPDEQ
jgi:hypothetical protein